jgi:hypothetical protein
MNSYFVLLGCEITALCFTSRHDSSRDVAALSGIHGPCARFQEGHEEPIYFGHRSCQSGSGRFQTGVKTRRKYSRTGCGRPRYQSNERNRICLTKGTWRMRETCRP